MKKILVLLALFVAVMSTTLNAETIRWSNPTTYVDGSSIPSAKAAALQAEIQYRIGTSFVVFGSTTGGADTFAASYVTPSGATSYWRIRSISPMDNNATSAWSPEYSYTRPFQSPGACAIQSVQ